MRKILKGAGASAMATATVVAGLSFGPAALAAPAPSPNASMTSNPADGTEFKLVTKIANGSFQGQKYASTLQFQDYPTEAEALAASTTWTVIANGDTFMAQSPDVKDGPNKTPGGCLSTYSGLFVWFKPLTDGTCDPSNKDLQWRVDDKGRVASVASASYISGGARYVNSVGLAMTKTDVAATFAGVNAGIAANVDSVDLANRTAKISGTAERNSTIKLDSTEIATVDDSGKWAAELSGLEFGDNAIHLENWVGDVKRSEKDLTVTLTVAPLSASAATGGANSDDLLVVGEGQPGATIAVENSAGTNIATTTTDETTGRYSATVAAPNAPGIQTLTVTQSLSGTAAGSVEVEFDYGTGVSISTPGEGFLHPGGPITFSGKGEAGGDIRITEEGASKSIGIAKVNSDGTWSIGDIDLDRAEHTFVVTQLSKGNNTTTAKLTVSPGQSNIVDPFVDSPAAGSTVETSRPTFTGHGEKGARVTIGYGANSTIGAAIVNNAGEWTINPTSGLALGESKLIVTQTAGTDVRTIDYTINRVAVEAPFRITSHANNQTYADGVTTFRGTAASGSTIKAVNQWGTVMGNTTADGNGNWAFNRNLGPTTEGYDITFTAAKAGKTESQTLHLNYQNAVAFQVTSPTNNSVYKPGIVTFQGKASPNTTVKAVNQWGTLMGNSSANLDGDWSFSRNLGPTAEGYDITFTATKGTDVQRTTLHLAPEAVNIPVAITSINDGDTYQPGQNILRGTGTPGATVTAVNALNGWNVAMGSAKVDTNGNWALPARNWGPSNDYEIKVTQVNPDKTTSTATVSIKAPRFSALTVDTFTVGAPNGPGVFGTFTGKATPGSTVTVKSTLTGSDYQKVTTGNDGTWSATRVWDPNHTYNLTFTQKAANGTTDTVVYGAFTPKNSK
jgi:hypothetical protein